jgi:hypothetical protein
VTRALIAGAAAGVGAGAVFAIPLALLQGRFASAGVIFLIVGWFVGWGVYALASPTPDHHTGRHAQAARCTEVPARGRSTFAGRLTATVVFAAGALIVWGFDLATWLVLPVSAAAGVAGVLVHACSRGFDDTDPYEPEQMADLRTGVYAQRDANTWGRWSS